MFEEIKNLKKIDVPFLKRHILCFSELLSLYNLNLLEIKTIKDFLSILIADNKAEQELIMVSMLITNDKYEFISMLTKLAEVQKINVSERKIFRPIWLVLKWFESSDCLPVSGFNLVELCSDLLAYFNYPKLEKKLFSKSFAEWSIVADNIKDYLKIDSN